ncbi:MAG: energy transducer TonB, partial [Myxococcales bacterium]|nr:energy transducer TonB [Myxococcales bacterium]
MHHSSERRRRLLGVGLSVAFHGLAFWSLDRMPVSVLEPIRVATVDFEVEATKPPPDPKPPEPKEPEPPAPEEPSDQAPTQPTAYHPVTPGSPRAVANQAEPQSEQPAGPIDLGTLSASDLGAADGDGVAVGVPGTGGGGRGPLPRGNTKPKPSSKPARHAPPPAPSYVAAKDLARPPRAPGLDGTLARYYPPAARAAGISGQATVRVAIDARGTARVVGILAESYAGFGSACQRTVQGS